MGSKLKTASVTRHVAVDQKAKPGGLASAGNHPMIACDAEQRPTFRDEDMAHGQGLPLRRNARLSLAEPGGYHMRACAVAIGCTASRRARKLARRAKTRNLRPLSWRRYLPRVDFHRLLRLTCWPRHFSWRTSRHARELLRIGNSTTVAIKVSRRDAQTVFCNTICQLQPSLRI